MIFYIYVTITYRMCYDFIKLVSKTRCREFESLLPCKLKKLNSFETASFFCQLNSANIGVF